MKNRKVLMIDDNLTIIKMLQVYLELEDIKMDYFTDSKTFLHKIRDLNFKEYDIIICDYKMPEFNGVIIFESLFNFVESEDLPKHKILYTGNRGQISVFELERLEQKGIKIYSKGTNDLDELFDELYNL